MTSRIDRALLELVFRGRTSEVGEIAPCAESQFSKALACLSERPLTFSTAISTVLTIPHHTSIAAPMQSLATTCWLALQMSSPALETLTTFYARRGYRSPVTTVCRMRLL